MLAGLAFALMQLSLPLGHQAMPNSTLPTDVCVTRSLVKVEKVEYRGKDNGQDQVYVEWRDAAASPCVYFGGGFDNPGQSNIQPFGHEVTVKIKRRLGNEDSATSKLTTVTNGNQVLTTVVAIPRGALETDPVSFDVTVRTTAGVVMVQTGRLTGNGVPVLTNATQQFTHHTSVPNVLGTCFPSVQVPDLSFLPGAGSNPDRVTIGLVTGLPQLADCFAPPKVSITVRATRPNGAVDTGQANVAVGQTTTTIPISGTPGSVASFEIIVTASAGSVVEKSAVSSGAF